MRWEPCRFPPASPPHRPPSFWSGLGRGACGRCPACGDGRLFAGYLRLSPSCSGCGAPLAALRADDAPPYFTIFLAGHLLLPFVLWIERAWQPPMWLHMALWLPLFTVICTLMLRPVKGAVVGWMMRLGITGTEYQEAPQAIAAAARDRGDA
jgi:uncharacterized protein (DUF983 family)